MTKSGAQALEKELEHLKSVERPRIITAIAEARAHGDLKENAEYHEAKREQGFIEGRIREIESKLSLAYIIDATAVQDKSKITFAATVTLLNVEDDKTVRYQIVGEDEADIKQQKVSVNSPIARALIGKKKGDEVTIKAPAGEIYYDVLEIEFI